MCDKARIDQRSEEEEIYKTLSQVGAKTAIKMNEETSQEVNNERRKKSATHTTEALKQRV